jgi:hypothetical protein
MKKVITIMLFGIGLFACHSNKVTFSDDEIENQIEKSTLINIENKSLVDGWYYISDKENEFQRSNEKTKSSFFINPRPIILPINFHKKEEFTNGGGDKGVAIYFDQYGTKAWSIATKNSMDSNLIYILGDKIVASPKVNSQITNGVCAFWEYEMSVDDFNKIKKYVKN